MISPSIFFLSGYSYGITKNGLRLWNDTANGTSYPSPFTGTTWVDLTGNSNGTLINGVGYNSTNGGVLTFSSASTQYVNYGNIMNYTDSDFTFTTWIKFTSIPAGQNTTIFSKGLPTSGSQADYWFQLNASNGLQFTTSSTLSNAISTTAANQIIANTWYYLAVIKTGTSIRIFINADDKTTVFGDHQPITPSVLDFNFGRHYWVGQYITAQVGDFLNYNRALSSAELLQNFNTTKPRYGFTSAYQTYTLDDSIITNPERGYTELTTTGSTEIVYNLVSQITLTNYRVIDGLTVIQRQFFLFLFIDGSPISEQYLANMQTDFNRIRNSGLKVMPRFTYTSKDATVYQPTKAQILAHITQLAPVINANKDVIVSIQAGFIGKYGEWFTTGSAEFGSGDYNFWTPTQLANRKEIVDAILSQFDESILLQLRTVFYKEMLYPSGNPRIGFVNDAFLNDFGDDGTFNVGSAAGTPSTTQTNIFQTASLTAPISGESNGLNPAVPSRTDGANAKIELDFYNWSLISWDYWPEVIDSWVASGDYDIIKKNLGYRFVLNSSTFTRNGNTINVNINLENIGYANSFRSRNAYIVFKNTSTQQIFTNQIITDVNSWYSTVVLNQTFDISTLPSGSYNSYIWLPDNSPSILNNPLYAIRLSNIGTWDSVTGYNNLNQTFVK